MSGFGIPYARVEFDEARGVSVRICPVCGARIDEPQDATGEALANPYGEHYAAEHDPGPTTTLDELGQA